MSRDKKLPFSIEKGSCVSERLKFAFKMRKTGIIGVLLFLVACGTAQDASIGVRSETRVVGIVHTNHGDCGLVIASENEGQELVFAPQNLEDKFKIDGMKLKFYYTPKKAAKGKCKATSVTVEDVSIMR